MSIHLVYGDFTKANVKKKVINNVYFKRKKDYILIKG